MNKSWDTNEEWPIRRELFYKKEHRAKKNGQAQPPQKGCQQKARIIKCIYCMWTDI